MKTLLHNNRRSSLLYHFIIFSSLLVIAAACHRKILPVTLPAPPKSVDIQEVNFDYFQGKARLIFKDNKKEREVKANIRIRKDSIIWMSFSIIGIQGGKVLINKDSITILNTVHKEYYVFNYNELSTKFNFKVDFHTIQAILLGNLICHRKASDKIISEEKFNRLSQEQGDVSIENLIHKETKKIEFVEIKESNTQNYLKVNYSLFQPLEDKLFPYLKTLEIQYRNNKNIIEKNIIEIEYSKAEVGNSDLRFPFNIPKRYDRR